MSPGKIWYQTRPSLSFGNLTWSLKTMNLLPSVSYAVLMKSYWSWAILRKEVLLNYTTLTRRDGKVCFVFHLFANILRSLLVVASYDTHGMNMQ